MREKLIVALDVSDRDDALRLVDQLGDHVGLFKVGLELYAACGMDIVREIGPGQVFLDLKFHDIPNTVAGVTRIVSRAGVRMLNVHATGGLEMMAAAVQAARAGALETSVTPPLVLAVTVLTSLDDNSLRQLLRVDDRVENYVLHLARRAKQSGLDGVVCSPKETALLRDTCGEDFTIVTPGIRPVSEDGAASASDDQKRVMTPAQALQSGADYIVVGRPITKATSPAEAAQRIVDDMERGST